MSATYSEVERQIREQTEQKESALSSLELDLKATTRKLDILAQKNSQYNILSKVCRSLEELEDLGASHLFWGPKSHPDNIAKFLEHAHQQIDAFDKDVAAVEQLRRTIIDKIGDQTETLEQLHYELHDAIEEEETRKAEWIVEREADELPHRAQIMPWTRGCEEDLRYRKSLATSVAASLAIAVLVSLITLPLVERITVNELPERVAKLVREERLPPPPVEVQEPAAPEEDIPEPELAEEIPEEVVPESVEEPVLADAGPEETREKVRSKGILAFRDSFANRASLAPAAQLGSQARISNAGTDAVGRPERSMVTTSAPGSSGGINLSDISRHVGGGGGTGLGGVEVSRVASSIGTGDGPDRPLSGGASAGRTDEEIQIVFDRYKAALYRLYNRALRRDPTLRGQMVLRLTIEPDGSVSLCELQSSDMNAPELAQQVVGRVQTFDFGAKEDIVAITIIYPIDFLPAA